MSRTHIWLPLLLVVTFVFLAASQIRSSTESSVFISDDEMSVMIELSLDEHICRMYTDRGGIQRMLLQSDPRRIHLVPRDSLMELETACRFGWNSVKDLIKEIKTWSKIIPGTNWCGAGNKSAHYNDLGRYVEEDRCCRDHDHCPKVLNVGDCRPGIEGQVCNKKGFLAYTISHCDCDANLRHCLSSLKTRKGDIIGRLFAKFVKKCFQERSPCSAHQKPTECAIELRPAEPYKSKRKSFWEKREDAPPFFPPLMQPRHYASRQNGYAYQDSASEDKFWMDLEGLRGVRT